MTPPTPSPKMPTVTEVLQHPAFPGIVWNLIPDRSGLLPVAEGRGGPFKISWEVHGEGPIKIIFIMGLGALKSAWQRQTLHFGHERRERYSVLVMDNRGMGDSDKPLMRYSSSEMARDCIEVLQHVGFLPTPSPSSPPASSPSQSPLSSSERCLHVVGLSLGGMIAQELAVLIPHHISTLSLCCTAAELENTTTFTENMANRINMLRPKPIQRSVVDTAHQIFPHSFLLTPDNVHLPTPNVTPKCGPPLRKSYMPGPGAPSPTLSATATANANANQQQTPAEAEYLRFDNNMQRFIAQEMHKRLNPGSFGLKGFLLQAVAAGWHRKTPAQLKELGDMIGRERILVMHGTEDNMISPPHGRKLIDRLQPGVGLILEGMGHVPIVERWEWYNNLIEERCALGEKLDGRA
ncbi:Alpha/Beta hydrolase protein [Diplogelasinospora grovesii]|uniref:Alpha/Beta hydrolase protein n=1 Tax=Diplogelasinospora grovesii TaxID=303347 RepID=A0AAN6N4D4_9PEZI|nr:Alpha/Beta hydrolase protein [Diplogelasinospora grovesii]